MKRLQLLAISLLLLAAGCVPTFLANDGRVTVGPALDASGQPIAGALRIERCSPEAAVKCDQPADKYATRINSGREITDWAPKDGCVRVTTTIGGPNKALKCLANPVVVYTLGQLDVGLVAP